MTLYYTIFPLLMSIHIEQGRTYVQAAPQAATLCQLFCPRFHHEKLMKLQIEFITMGGYNESRSGSNNEKGEQK